MNLLDLQLTVRAERCLCLSRAFLPPLQESDFAALTVDLPADLEELDAELGWIGPERLAGIEASLTAFPDHAALLSTYSRLFLAPPAPALLNMSLYLDGGTMGSSCGELEGLYLAHGLQRDPKFRDGSDHFTLFLQFLAWSYAQAQRHLDTGDTVQARTVLREAGGAVVRHGLPAIGHLVVQLRKAESALGLSGAYGEIAEMTRLALTDDARTVGARLGAGPAAAAEVQALEPAAAGAAEPAMSDSILACSHCTSPFLAESALATLVDALAANGLDAGHLRVCPRCRTTAMGLTPMEAPRLRKAS